jgi:hypothetical protein
MVGGFLGASLGTMRHVHTFVTGQVLAYYGGVMLTT